MNEKIMARTDRKGRFGNRRVRSGMDGLKLGQRDSSQLFRLLLCVVESVYNRILRGGQIIGTSDKDHS